MNVNPTLLQFCEDFFGECHRVLDLEAQFEIEQYYKVTQHSPKYEITGRVQFYGPSTGFFTISMGLATMEALFKQYRGNLLRLSPNVVADFSNLLSSAGQRMSYKMQGECECANIMPPFIVEGVLSPFDGDVFVVLIKHAVGSMEIGYHLGPRKNNICKALQESFDLLEHQQEDKLSALSVIVAGIAHEVNTPLGVAMSMASYFEDELAKISSSVEEGKLSKKQFKNFVANSSDEIKLLTKNLKRVAQLVRDFRNISVEQHQEEKRVFDLHEQLQDIVAGFQQEFQKSARISVKVNCPSPLWIESYPNNFSKIISNLIINALVHAVKGRQEGQIEIGVKLKGKALKLQFRDDGVGVDKNCISKILEPFYTSNRENGNTGLGLHIVHNLVTGVFGGKLKISSDINKGFEMNMEFPKSKAFKLVNEE